MPSNWQYQQLAEPIPPPVPSASGWFPVLPQVPGRIPLSAALLAGAFFSPILPPVPPQAPVTIIQPQAVLSNQRNEGVSPVVPPLPVIHYPVQYQPYAVRQRQQSNDGAFVPVVTPPVPTIPFLPQYQPYIARQRQQPNDGAFVPIVTAAPPPLPPSPMPSVAVGTSRQNGGFVQIFASQVVSPVNKNSLAYLVRDDINQIAVLDTITPAAVDFAVYYCHTFTGQDQHRASRKNIVKINVYGEGAIGTNLGSAYMIVVCDNSRTDVYPYSAQSPNPAIQSIWSQNVMQLQGRSLDICFLLMGSGINIREVEVQYYVNS